MNNELITKINNYIAILEEKLQNLRDERQELVDKFNDGEELSRQERKQNKNLAIQIKKVSKALTTLKECEKLKDMYNSVVTLATLPMSEEEKNAIIDDVVTYFKEYADEENIDEILDLVEFEEGEEKTVASVKEKLQEELEDLKYDLRRAKKRNKSAKEIKEIQDDIKATESDLAKVSEYEESVFDEETARKQLNDLSDVETPQEEKDQYVNAFGKSINSELNSIVSDVEEDMAAIGIDLPKEANRKNDEETIDEDLDEEELDDEELDDDEELTFKDKVKAKLAKVGNFLNKQKRKIAAIAGVVILGATILFVSKSCSKESTRNPGDNLDDSSLGNSSTTIDNETRKTIADLVAKGYNEYIAGLMVQNFDASVIEGLLARPYIPAMENYATVSAYPINLDYVPEYEQARTTYNLLSEDAVDYVNRAHKIYDLKFYDDASILDIVDVICAIDHKDLMTQSNASLAQSFNTTFNRITDGYLFGTVSPEQISKIDAIPYFAREGSDMHAFLNRFATLEKGILEQPNDTTAKNEMYKFINIFATSLNGFTNVPEALTEDETFNKDAQVNDYYDWFMAYNSFIAPLYPTYGTEETFVKFAELQNLMITALDGPEFEEICGIARTRTINELNGINEIEEGGN